MKYVVNEVKHKKEKFGEINISHMVIYQRRQKIKLESILNVRWIKKQKYTLNYLCFVAAASILFLSFSHSQPQVDQLFELILGLLLLISSYFLKFYEYTFLILFKKQNFIAIPVSKKLSQDAIFLAKQFNNLTVNISTERQNFRQVV